MGYTEFDLAKRIHNTGKDVRVEIAEITSISPLKIMIGNAEYDSTFWEIYEPYFEDKDAEIKNGLLGVAGSSSVQETTFGFEKGTYEESTSYMRYKVGDKVAVQQMVGDKSFIILCKIRRVE